MFSSLRNVLPICLLIAAAHAQENRIQAPVDRTRTVLLHGQLQLKARSAYDRGAVDRTFAIPAMTLLLKQSSHQQAALHAFISEQHNAASSSFHKWLTPEQYADRFGISTPDIERISNWLRSEGFAVKAVARARNWIVFQGTAGQVQTTFHTSIHRYEFNGELHFANATEPSIPGVLADIVSGIHGLHNFIPEAPAVAHDTINGTHYLAPDDIATIYNIAPLYARGIDGTGQRIAIVGQSNVNLADIQAFRTRFHLSAPNLEIHLVPNFPDPGTSLALTEAGLDIEWSSAVARNATIVYVYSADVFDAVQYAIDNTLAQVLSMSFSACEQEDIIDLPYFQALAQQANASGMTWVNSSGDAGAASCDPNGSARAENGPGVRFPASIPEVTGVGGSQFTDQSATYWNASNDPNTGVSALSYVPETSWSSVGLRNSLWASGGGVSIFFSKPVWQNLTPNDNFRDVPDVAFAASPELNGYLIVSSGRLGAAGGTSAGAPLFAGIVALLNQSLGATGLGNINPSLYRLAQTTTDVFHDITTGNNIVPCAPNSPNCSAGSFGYSAGPGYDLVTGLGSLDANNFVQEWSTRPAVNSSAVVDVTPNPVYQTTADADGYSWFYKITVTEEAGAGTTLTDFTIDGVSYASSILTFFGSAALPPRQPVSATLKSRNLTAPHTTIFTLSGIDASGRQWSQQLAVPFVGPQAQPQIAGASNAASFQKIYAPGMIMSVFGSGLGSAAQLASITPLPRFMAGVSATVNGSTAPLFYVSPTQVNLQIPYGTANGTATLKIYNVDTLAATATFLVSDSAPGIFAGADGAPVPHGSGARGQSYILFITGQGQVSPSPGTGNPPSTASLFPRPVQTVTMTIGGVDTPIQFAGIPYGLVGVTQVNFTVPAGAPLGKQPLVVTVGAASSAPVSFTVTQ